MYIYIAKLLSDPIQYINRPYLVPINAYGKGDLFVQVVTYLTKHNIK